jgi:hypothetical protein
VQHLARLSVQRQVPTPVHQGTDDPDYWDRVRKEQEDEQQRQSTGDADRSFLWDIATLSPLGAVAATGVDVAKMAYHGLTGDSQSAARDASDAGWDALSAVPILGTGLSIWEGIQDAGASQARGMGASPESAPTSGDSHYDWLVRALTFGAG